MAHGVVSSIVIAPFSNSDIRDWPAEHFTSLIGYLVTRWTGLVRVIGTSSQRLRANEIVRDFDPLRVVNECGRLPWAEVVRELRAATCVIGNNSGIAHLAGSYGVPTVCVFGGSHQRLEWRPMGAKLVLISRSIGCSPCGLDHGGSCPYNKACLNQIEPATVADVVLELIGVQDRSIRPVRDEAMTSAQGEVL